MRPFKVRFKGYDGRYYNRTVRARDEADAKRQGALIREALRGAIPLGVAVVILAGVELGRA